MSPAERYSRITSSLMSIKFRIAILCTGITLILIVIPDSVVPRNIRAILLMTNMFLYFYLFAVMKKRKIASLEKEETEKLNKTLNELADKIGPFHHSNVEPTHYGYNVTTEENEKYLVFIDNYKVYDISKE